MSTASRILTVITTAAAISAAAGTANGQVLPSLPDEGRSFNYVGRQVQDYTIPGYVGTVWQLSIEGADGGYAERRSGGSRVESRDGGQGATMGLQVRIGHGSGELRPGGTIRFIVPERGEAGSTISTDPFLGAPRAGGGGGGGGAILYLPPTESDWNNAIILAAAGGGGGGFIVGGFAAEDHTGGNAQLYECSGNPTDGCNSSDPRSCDGGPGSTAGTSFREGQWGAGAYPTDAANMAMGRHGFPDGADPAQVQSGGGWGFGAGGYADRGPGGGGGYSGGGAYYGGEDYVASFECQGGGGGGGSHINPDYALTNTAVRTPGNSGLNGAGSASIVTLSVANDEPSGSVLLRNGDVTAATFDNATPSPIPVCDGIGGWDLWYHYTNTSDCVKEIVLSAAAATTAGDQLSADTININAYDGLVPVGTSCRGSSGSGTYTDVVEPGETISFGVYANIAAPGPEVTALLSFTATDVPYIPSIFSPQPLELGVERTERFCGVPFGTLDYNSCDGTLTEGQAAYYEYVNTEACTLDVSFTVTAGALSGVRIFDVANGCQQPVIGEMSRTMEPGDRMLLQFVSQTGESISFRVDSAYTAGQPDCDGDGIPDSCDPDGPCGPPANDDMANATPIGLLGSSYTTVNATPDGTSSCDAGDVVDVWFSHVAQDDGQLIVSALSDGGSADSGQLGLTLFAEDGVTELHCDRGFQTDRPRLPEHNSAAFASVREGETVLIRVSTPAGSDELPIARGTLTLGFGLSLTNDICSNAQPIELAGAGTETTVFFPRYAQNEGSDGFCFAASEDLYDTWYTFTAPASGSVTFAHMLSGFPLAGGLELYDSCGGTLLDCSGGAEPVVSTSVAQGQTVTLRALHLESAFEHNLPYLFTTFEAGCSAADLNTDGVLNNTDINLFVNAFLAGQAAADLNSDSTFNNTDINLFVNLFVAGCP